MTGLRETIISELMAMAEEGWNIQVLVSDSTSTSKVKPLQDKYPDRIINVGIAEQNLIGVAAGLSLEGFIPVTANAAPFLVGRANEQVKNDIAYSNSNVKMLGLNAGVSYGALGSTHHAIDDISIMMGFGNIEIYSPSDPVEAAGMIRYAVEHTGPVYIRLDSQAYSSLHDDTYVFLPGELDVLIPGDDAVLFATGSVVCEAAAAAEKLKACGIDLKVVSVPSLHPLRKEAVIEQIKPGCLVFTAEEHSVHGGLGSIISEIITEAGLSAKLYRCGIPSHEFSIAGPQKEVWAYYGFDAEGLCLKIKNALKGKHDG